MMTDFITSTNLTHLSIRHGFFTRQGGVSSGEYASLNVGPGSGDDIDHIRENRTRVASAMGSTHDDILTCHQIHSNIAHIITPPPAGGLGGRPLNNKNASPLNPPASGGHKLEGDALVTNTPGIAISVLTADCVPVLLADTNAGVIGAAHAGWKGAHAGIIANTIRAMQQLGATPATISAAIGPAIQQTSFEVGAEVKQQFTSLNADFAKFFISGADGIHFHFDLTGLVSAQLSALGVANIETLPYDTYADEQRFFSYRRSTHQQQTQYGRQCSVIILG